MAKVKINDSGQRGYQPISRPATNDKPNDGYQPIEGANKPAAPSPTPSGNLEGGYQPTVGQAIPIKPPPKKL